MTKQITITDKQLRRIKNAIETQRDHERSYAENDDMLHSYFCEGQANGMEFVLRILEID